MGYMSGMLKIIDYSAPHRKVAFVIPKSLTLDSPLGSSAPLMEVNDITVRQRYIADMLTQRNSSLRAAMRHGAEKGNF